MEWTAVAIVALFFLFVFALAWITHLSERDQERGRQRDFAAMQKRWERAPGRSTTIKAPATPEATKEFESLGKATDEDPDPD